MVNTINNEAISGGCVSAEKPSARIVMRKIFLFLFALSLTGIACESESEKYARLQNEYQKLRQRKDNLEGKWTQLKAEQEKSWQCNAKERFAFLYPISAGKWQQLEHEDYIQSICISEESSCKYEICVKIKPGSKIKPFFHVYLHDKRGLIVGSFSVKPFLKVKAGKEREYKETLNTQNPAFYYRLDIIDN